MKEIRLMSKYKEVSDGCDEQRMWRACRELHIGRVAQPKGSSLQRWKQPLHRVVIFNVTPVVYDLLFCVCVCVSASHIQVT